MPVYSKFELLRDAAKFFFSRQSTKKGEGVRKGLSIKENISFLTFFFFLAVLLTSKPGEGA